MTASLRVAWTLAGVLVHVLVALAIVGLLFPFSSVPARRRFVRWWSGRVLTVCRLQLRVIGPATGDSGNHDPIDRALRPGGIGAMLVTNHISWLDIFVVHSLRAARFVAKAEIARWPLLGFLTERTGAVFVERGKRHAVREVNQRVTTLLAAGELVGMFPEGAVSDGNRLLPFHGNLVQPAIDAAVPVIVGGFRYRDLEGRPTTAIDYVGDVTLLDSIVRIARHGPLIVELHLIEVLDAATMTRHEVARAARKLIGGALGLDDERVNDDRSTATAVAVVLSRDVVPADRSPGTTLDPRGGSP